MTSELLWLEAEADAEGPYFLGKQFSAVDVALLPWFIRLYVLKHYRGFEMPKDCKKLVAWYALLVLTSPNSTAVSCFDDESHRESAWGREHFLL